MFFVTFIGFFTSITLHEFGHCLFYRVQGIPAQQSLVKEYPMHDITVTQYAIGSWGGILLNWIFITVLFFLAFYFNKRQKGTASFITRGFFYGQSILLLIYGIFLIKGEDKTEFVFAQNLLHMPLYSIVIITLIMTGIFVYLFVSGHHIKITVPKAVLTVCTIVFLIIFTALLEEYDAKTNWHKYPTVKIGDMMLYNEPVK